MTRVEKGPFLLCVVALLFAWLIAIVAVLDGLGYLSDSRPSQQERAVTAPVDELRAKLFFNYSDDEIELRWGASAPGRGDMLPIGISSQWELLIVTEASMMRVGKAFDPDVTSASKIDFGVPAGRVRCAIMVLAKLRVADRVQVYEALRPDSDPPPGPPVCNEPNRL